MLGSEVELQAPEHASGLCRREGFVEGGGALDSHLNCNTGMLRSCNGNDL